MRKQLEKDLKDGSLDRITYHTQLKGQLGLDMKLSVYFREQNQLACIEIVEERMADIQEELKELDLELI